MPSRSKRAIAIAVCSYPIAAAGVARAANTAADVCQRWVCDRADVSEGMSTGNVATCDPGDLLPPGRPNALKLVNLYRFLAGMPAVTEDPTRDMQAQACAIIQAANPLSHTVATTTNCYTMVGATASNQSSICSGQAVGCIDLYMNDANGGGPGFGHRQWIFANSLGPVGFGSVGTGRGMTGSCFQQVNGTGKANIPFVAWPPPGPVPLAAITTTNVDKAGWSIQSDTINTNSASATVTDGTTNLAVTVANSLPSFGARYAMSILPMGWTEQAGHNYTVTVSGTTTPITYTIQVQDCAGVTTAGCGASGTGGAGGGPGTTTGAGGATGTGGAGAGGGPGAGGGGSGGSGPAVGSGGSGATGTGGAGATATSGTGGIAVRIGESPGQGGCSCTVRGGGGRDTIAGAVAIGLLLLVRRRRARRR